jgi:hypothetical protein
MSTYVIVVINSDNDEPQTRVWGYWDSRSDAEDVAEAIHKATDYDFATFVTTIEKPDPEFSPGRWIVEAMR